MNKIVKILIIAVFSFVMFASSAVADECGSATQSQIPITTLVGTWSNELGSKLTINNEENGQISGYYETSVSQGGCAKGKFPLVGRTNLPLVGFVVSWTNESSKCNSVTTWSGQLQKDKLVTTWLLTLGTVPKNNWQSTYVNKDIFTKESSPNVQK
ncbi:MAG TPA: avidin/streptavidin family protein [Leptolyngbyaceae cyanobacterium]